MAPDSPVGNPTPLRRCPSTPSRTPAVRPSRPSSVRSWNGPRLAAGTALLPAFGACAASSREGPGPATWPCPTAWSWPSRKPLLALLLARFGVLNPLVDRGDEIRHLLLGSLRVGRDLVELALPLCLLPAKFAQALLKRNDLGGRSTDFRLYRFGWRGGVRLDWLGHCPSPLTRWRWVGPEPARKLQHILTAAQIDPGLAAV